MISKEELSKRIAGIPDDPNPRIRQIGRPFHHLFPIQQRFSDVDILGHINNTVYLQYLDLGKSRYLECVRPEAVDWKTVTIVVVNINCDFLAPTYFQDKIVVLTTVESVSDRSFVMLQRIVDRETGQVKCQCRTVMAGFDPSTATGAPIEKEWVDAFCSFEGCDLRRKP